MAEKAERMRSPLKRNISVAVVLLLAAAMFTVSAKQNAGYQHRHPEDLVSLVRVETERNQALEDTTLQLQASVDQFTQSSAKAQDTLDQKTVASEGVESGALPVHGPGVRVALSDAPAGQVIEPPLTVDDLVVHQQDLQAVISALWAGGAEAMTLQGQRVTALTAFRCVGNVLLLHGQVYSPPYVVEAIGDQQRLQAALENSEAINIYKQYVAAVGLGWKTENVSQIDMPVAGNISQLKFAQVPQGTNIWD